MKYLALALFLFSPVLCSAENKLTQPSGEIILEVNGATQHTNNASSVHFDRAMINALPTSEIITSNHVSDTPTIYTGPKLSLILDRLGIIGNIVRVTALDDYTAVLSRSDIQKYGVLLATHENGHQLTLDDRGPFFIVFPFDDFNELKKDIYYTMSVWQVMSIDVQ